MNALSHAKGRVFGHIIAEHNATGGAALKQYIWLGDTPLAVFDSTTLYYVHPDHLDRPVAMTNASATMPDTTLRQQRRPCVAHERQIRQSL
jgi:hypothetical protein